MFRLLCVVAHPDDEAGGFGGSLALYGGRGVQTHVLCLTAGEAASHRGSATSAGQLGALRRAEFAASCKLLGVGHAEVLEYPDGKLDRIELGPAVAEITQRIRRIRPQVLLTFGPEGAVTAHPDHSMASVFATLAYHWAGRSNRFPEQLASGLAPHCAQKLYYATASFTLPDRPPVSPAPATAEIDIGEHLETKIAAFKMHATQAPLFKIFEHAVQGRGRRELFHLAAASKPRASEHETDLLAGVRED